jgi:hypothetical protein
MNAKGLGRGVSLQVLVVSALNAQGAREHDLALLKNWPAPLYWQPTHIDADERTAATTATDISIPAIFSPRPPGFVFVAITPCRVVDTRTTQGFSGAFGPPMLVGGASRTFPMQSSTTCPILSIAKAYSLNITVVPPGPLGFTTAYPTGQPLPLAARVTSPQGFIVGNAPIVPAGSSGSIDIFASSATDIVIDINGYYASPTDTNDNTAIGNFSLEVNTSGAGNTAVGARVLASNTTGSDNTAIGAGALNSNTTGGNNIAVGHRAAGNVFGGNSNNIHIGSGVPPPTAVPSG